MTTPLHHKGIESIAKEHRILNIGLYNPVIVSCGFCCGTENIDPLREHCLGFGSPAFKSGPLYKTLAVVYECPECFERLWSHEAIEGYYAYLRFIYDKENK
jgi:hypothetical protein